MVTSEFCRGDIYLCDFGDPIGHEAGYRRPAMILSATAANRYGLCVVVPITSKCHGYPTHVELEGVLPVVSYMQCELLGTISTNRLSRRLGEVDELRMVQAGVIVRRLLML